MDITNNVFQQISDRVAQLSQGQRERLIFIDFCLFFLGQVSKSDLIQRFQIASAAATRDFALYKELKPENLSLDRSSKKYVVDDERFICLFEHDFDRTMVLLSKGLGESVGDVPEPLISCDVPHILNKPSISILATVSRAVNLKKVLNISYVSMSGESQREIVPFTFAYDGLRWHVRAFDRKKERFTDFVISRMKSAEILKNSTVAKYETQSEDDQWNRIVDVELIPHPKHQNPIISVMDFDMVNGVLKIKIRAAMVGYVLRQWHVDCSPEHSIDDQAFRLCLKDPLVLYGVESAVFAPGYVSPEKR